jgi:hypothetical protein
LQWTWFHIIHLSQNACNGESIHITFEIAAAGLSLSKLARDREANLKRLVKHEQRFHTYDFRSYGFAP